MCVCVGGGGESVLTREASRHLSSVCVCVGGSVLAMEATFKCVGYVLTMEASRHLSSWGWGGGGGVGGRGVCSY